MTWRKAGNLFTTLLALVLPVGLVVAIITAAWSMRHDPNGLAADCVEDAPCWDCETMGNRLCGDPDHAPLYSPSGAPVTLVEVYYQGGTPAWTWTTYEDGTRWIECHAEACHNVGAVGE